jgi:hypothetical protein
LDPERLNLKDPWIDDAFRVEKCRWGTWVSFDKVENKLVTSPTEELCIEATRFYLKGKQEGFPGQSSSYASTVEGKL